MLNYADKYIQSLKQGMYKNSACVDTSYAREVVADLQSFAALVRMECLNDMTLLHQDMNYAKNMQDSYEDFAEYCYDMLKQAFNATNEILSQCNQLFYDLRGKLNFEHTDICVASNYIVFNAFGQGNMLELYNFKRMTGIGMCYDMRMRQQTIVTNNVQEQMQSKFDNLVELADVIRCLRDASSIAQSIDAWSAIVNDKLADAKLQAMAAWNATYKAYKNDWFNVEFTKQNAATYCNLVLTTKKVYEMLHNRGKTKKLDYGIDHMKVLQLDYVNNSNFEFK